MAGVHTKTKLEEELISILIETFENHGWTIDELPSIFDSDEKPNNLTVNTDNLDIENYLGIYRLKDKCLKGEVVLYCENIKDLSNRYFYELEMRGKEIDGKPIFEFLTTDHYLISANEVFEYLKSIVLIHELTHWMIHWNSDFNQKSLKCDDKYESIDEINFHEGLAQYFTNSVIRQYGDKKIIDLFESLNSRQSNSYEVYKELQTDLDNKTIDISSVFTALAICWFDRFSQSFITLKDYNNSICEVFDVKYFTHFLTALKEKKKPQKQEELSNLFKKHSSLFFAEYFNDEYLKINRGKINGIKFGL